MTPKQRTANALKAKKASISKKDMLHKLLDMIANNRLWKEK